MGRPSKQTVEYFPHYVHHGKTLFILEQRWGDHGYAGFYKLMEILCDEPGHYYDARKVDKWEFLCAKMGVSGPEILQKLSDLEIIDSSLWSHHIIWMESLVESIKDVYNKRSTTLPTKPDLSQFLPPKTGENPSIRDGNTADGDQEDISGVNNPQSKVNKSKVKESKEKSIGDKPPSTRFIPPSLEEVETYCRDRNNRVNAKKWFDHYTSNGWKVGKNKMVDWKAAVRTWEDDNQGGFNGTGHNSRGSERKTLGEAPGPGHRSEYPVDVVGDDF